MEKTRLTPTRARWRLDWLVAGLFVVSGLFSCAPKPVHATDLGVEGPVFEVIEDDFRLMLMRLIARHDWTPDVDDLKESARNYTKNLPALYLPRAEQTRTQWKDVGVIVTEDIYLPWVDWKTGSVFEPGRTLAVKAGTYLNPTANLPSAGIERLFIFDATDPEQLTLAKALMRKHIPQLSFMLIAGDLGPLSEEMNQPVFYPTPTMLEKFHVRAVPTLLGFGRGIHQGHMAITEIRLPTSLAVVQQAWFGLGDKAELPAETSVPPLGTEVGNPPPVESADAQIRPAAADPSALQ